MKLCGSCVGKSAKAPPREGAPSREAAPPTKEVNGNGSAFSHYSQVMTTCSPQQSNHHPPAPAQPVITSVQPYNLASYLGRDQSYRDADQAYRNAVQLAQYGTGQLHKSDSAGHTRAQAPPGGAHHPASHPASQAAHGQGPHVQGYSHYETLPGANREAVTVHRPPDRPPLKKTQSLGPPAVPDRTIMATDIRAVDLTDRGKVGGYGDPFYDLDLHYITERIIAMSFPIDGHEAAYKNNMKDLARMLQTKHGHNYMVLNLSERRSDLTLYNRKVLEYGWPEDVAPPLERLCSLCKEMDTWLNSDPQRVVVLHCKGKKGRTGVVIAAFMHYSNICASADQALDRFAMKRFYEDKLGQISQPSQKRYVHYFAGLLTGAIKINSSPLYLHQIILHGVPTFDDRTNGCRPFVKVYLAMEPVHTSGVYNLTDGMQRICFNVEPGIQLRGDVMIKAYHKRPRQQARDVIFRTQFHTCAISKFGYTLTKAELDDACTDRRFPDTGKVELLFSPGPQKQGPHFYHDPPPLLVDDSRDTIVRWDSYSDFTRQQNAPRENGEVHDHESLDHHVQGPLDGSLYATVTKQRVVTRETTSSTSSALGQHHVTSGALPAQHVASTEIKDSTHNSMDSGISNTTTGGNKQQTGVTGVNVSVITSQPTLEQQYTSPRHSREGQTTLDQYSLPRSGQTKLDQYSSNRSQTLESQYSSTRHARAHSTPRNEFSSLRQDQRNDQQELDAVLNDLLGSDGMMTSPRSRQVTSYNSWESRSGTDTSGYVKRSYQYTDSADPSKNVSKTEYSSDMDALTRLLTMPGGYTQKADALDLAMPDNSSTWLEEQQRKLRKSHARPRTEQELKLVEELKSAQDKFIGHKSTSGEDRRSSYYTYVDDQSGYMSEPEGASYRNKRYSKGYGEPRYNTLQYSTTLVTDMNKPPASPGNQRSMSPAVPSRTSSRDAMTRSRSATRGEWTSHARPLHRQNSDLSHDRYNRSPKGSPARPESPLNYRPTLHSASSTLERSEVREVRAVPPPRSTSFTYEPRVYTEQRVLMRNMPKQHETPARYLETDTKQYLMKDRLEGPTDADPTIYSQEDLENALRQLEDLQSLTLDAETRAPPDGTQDLHNSFGSSNADSSVSSLNRDVFVLDKAHDVSVSSVSSSEKVHGTTPVHVQTVRVAPDVNTAELTPGTAGATPGKPGKPRAEVTTCTRTIKHPRDKDKVSDEARKHYNSLGERLEELERSLQAAQNAISAEAALRREKELRDAREKDEKDRAEKAREAREARERMERESHEREERLRREREVIEREIREREIIHIREKDRGDDERLAREARDRERLLELERKEQELLEKERQLRALEAAPLAPPAPRTPDVVDSGTRTITRTYMIEPSTQAVDFKTKAKRRRSSVEDIYLLKPIGVHTLETDEPDAVHEVRAASTPVENRSATLPSASSEAITPPFPVSPGTPYVNKGILTPGGASHKVVEATVHRSGFGGHTEAAPAHFNFPEGGGQAAGAGLQVGVVGGGGVVSESHQYNTIGGAHSPGPQKLVQIHKTTTETRRTDSPVQQHVSPAQQRHLESQRVEGRRFETAGADGAPGLGEHFEVTTIRKEHQEHGPEVFVESGGSSLNQSFETSSASAGGSYSYQTETRHGGAAGSTSSLPHGARMNTSVGSGGGGAGGHEYHTRTTTVTQENSPKQQFSTVSGSSGYTNEARNRSGGGASSGAGGGGSVVHEYYSNTSSAHNENSPNQYSFESSPGVQRSGGYSYSTSSQFSEGGGGGGGGGKSVSISEGAHHGGESSGKQNQYSWSVEGGSSGAGGSRMHQSYSESSSVAGGQQSGMNHSWSGEGYSTRSGEGYSTRSGEGYSTRSGEGYSTRSGEGYSTRSGEGYSGRSVSESGGGGGGYSYQYSSQNGAQSPPTLTVDTSYVSHTRNNSSLSSNSQFSPASPNTMAQLRSQLSKSESSGGQTYLSPNRQGSPATSTYTGMSRQASLQSLAFIDTVDMINHTPKFVKDLSKFWYKPNISRDDAIVLLKDKPAGTFVVRDSNSFPGAFGLALKVESLPPNVQSKGDPETELVRHFLIESTSKGVRMKGCNNEPVFASLSTLIYQHTITPLALPCKLVLPESAVVELDDTDSKEMVPGSAQALLAQGAACNVLYIFSVDTESLTGPQALSRAMTETKKVQPKTTEVHFKVSSQGVTLTDNLRKLFFRRHYPVNTVTYCGMDPDDTRWLTKQENGKEITAKVFGFVARKPGSLTDNSCHIFAELDPEQPASAIVNFVTKVMIGSHQGKKS